MRRRSTRSGGGTIRRNAARGAAAERQVARRYRGAGYAVKRTGRGSDFVAAKRSRTTGRTMLKIVEVKSGGAQLSPTQRRAKRTHGRRYVVERVGGSGKRRIAARRRRR